MAAGTGVQEDGVRFGRRALAGAVAVGVLGAAGAVVGARDDAAPVAPDVPLPAPSQGLTPLLPALADDGPVPSPAGLAAVVAGALADPALGGALAVSVVDVRTGEPLLEQRADVRVVPASTAKIATAVAALTALDPALRISTRVVAGAGPGEVVLVGGGDSSLAGPDADAGYPRVARLTDLATQLSGVGVTRVLVDDSAWPGPRLGPGWKPTYVTSGDVAPVTALMVDGGRVRPGRGPRSADPALAAGQVLARLLDVAAPVARTTAPEQALVLASVQSPPVPLLVEAMLTRSDNDLAEALARQVALAEGEAPTFSGAAAAVAAVLGRVLSAAGLDVAAVDLSDGSGLSRLDRVQPAGLTRLLAAVAGGEQPRLAPVLSGLPVAGFDGTLARRYRSGPSVPAAGVVRAKTGTLLGVSALAGLVRTADGRLLAFDLTADAVPIGATRAAERALDRLAAALASCGCR